jgi:hypothetical protein
LAEWNLRKEKLTVYFEKDNEPVTVIKQNFFLNQMTKKKVAWFYLSLNR